MKNRLKFYNRFAPVRQSGWIFEVFNLLLLVSFFQPMILPQIAIKKAVKLQLHCFFRFHMLCSY
jgi:hypothetical protein